MYQNYIFDLYGTLIDLHTNEQQEKVWAELAKFYVYNGADYEKQELHDAYLAEVTARLQAITVKRETDHPDTDISDVFAFLYRAKKVKPSSSLVRSTTRLFRSLSLEYLRLYDGVAETLQVLKERGGKLFLLSNGQREFSLPELQHLGIDTLFDGLFFSADYELCKPDVRFMEALFEAHGIGPKQSVMIGNDHTTDIEIARRLHMDALYIHTNCSHNISQDQVHCKYQIWDNDFRRLQSFFSY